MERIFGTVILTSISCAAAQLFISPPSQSALSNGVVLITCICNSTCSLHTWMKNGRKITNDSPRFKVIRSSDNQISVLRIQPVKWKVDDGIYNCSMDAAVPAISRLTVYNSISEVPSGSPRLSDNVPSMEVTPEGILLSCSSTAQPKPAITWYKNQAPVTFSGGNEASTNGSLLIKELPQEGRDIYECQVSNSQGSDISSPLSINASVATPTNLTLTLLEGSSVHVTWNPPKFVGAVTHYKVEYGVESEASHVEETLNGNIHQFTTSILERGEHYEFLVSSKTPLGWSEKAVSRIKTLDGVPLGSPLNITASEIGPNGFQLNWVPPLAKHRRGRILMYEVRERSDEKIEDWTVNTTEASYTVRNLEPQSSHSFQIRAYTSAGPGPWSSYVQILTKPESALQPPRGIKLNRISPSELEVSWQVVASDEPVSYEVFATIHATSDLSEWQRRTTGQTSITFDEAQSTSYAVRVRSFVPSGKFSDLSRVVIETSSYYPDLSKFQPSGLGIRNLLASLVKHGDVQDALLEWIPPEKVKFSHYQISYDGSKHYKDEYNSRKELVHKKQKKVDKNQSKVKVENLHPGTLYKFIVSACFSEDICGVSQSSLLSTEPRVPPQPEPPSIIKIERDGTVALKLRAASEINGAIMKYHLVLVNGSLFEDRMPSDITSGEISFHLHPRQPAGKSSLLVFEFKILPEHLVLEKFPSGKKHKIFLRAYASENMYVSSPYSNLLDLTSKSPNEAGNLHSKTSASMIFLVVTPIIFCLVAVGVLAVICYRQKMRKVKKYKEIMRDEHVAMQTEKFIAETTEYLKPPINTPIPSNCRPVTVKNIGKVLDELKMNDGAKLRKEYESIDPGEQFTWEASSREENKAKNRYANVVAYDHTRVKISPEFTGCDYINANFIDGYCRAKTYIATQGPMPNTVADFWRMIWEQKCQVIVMVSNVMERNRIKCDQYWPQTTELYGMVYVSLTDTSTFATYVMRTLQLTNVNTLEKRVCTQYQFTAWPEQGVPSSPSSFLNFVKRVKLSLHLSAAPLVVHCSAGVGRTGVFIAVDALLERLQFEEVLDICSHVTLMRSQRNYMVQTEEQYRFLYEVVTEAVQFGGSEISADRFLFRVNELFAVHPRAGFSEVQMEFKKLQTLFTTSSQTLKTFTNQKNKLKTMTLILNDEDKQSHDFIDHDLPNTNLVDSYKEKKAFIATEAPTSGSTDEFWKMLWDLNSSIIVVIAKIKENGKILRHQYWPEHRSTRYKYFVVDPVAQYNMPLFTLREFKMTDARDGQSRMIRHFHYLEWPDQGVPQSGEGFVEFIGQIQKTKQQFGLQGPTTVHCSQGDDKTGIFMAVNNILERLRYEGIIDIFQAVKFIHSQKPSFHPSEAQYRFCYQAVLEYLSSFDHIIS